MSYATVENAAETLLKAVTGYSATNVSKGDYRILAKGNMKAVVMQPGAFDRSIQPSGIIINTWNINLELLIAFRTELSDIETDIRTERQNIINQMDKYPALNATAGVLFAGIVSGEEPEAWVFGSGKYWRQMLKLQVKEQAIAVYAE